ncbi:arylsulfatase [Rubritalea tangerina]|uniref:Arylsulfatase n=1 Tax=Rubritalea tangerina TaxID=430798 RepID=A0ABW4ZBL1_9BACT
MRVLVCWMLGLVGWVCAQPNVVFVITDDQGYGDIACHGHPYVKTPHLDKLVSESVNLDDYHVFPTCSPSRASILTGHWANRTGVWHTINGRSLLREGEVTVAEMFKEAGYATGIFGKWHLGDAYPFRPQDRGFSEVYVHGAGGVGQTPDVWDNAYFGGGYYHNGKKVRAEGFCTDVFFAEGRRFIRECVKEERPFFAYISTNAPHGPLHCPEKYLDLYQGKPARQAAFYGMISNIDENVGSLRAELKSLAVERDTIFIFTTDNGTATGESVFNAGMRGKKNSEYDGGHRVPFIIHWPGGEMQSRRHVRTLTHAVDVTPTLLDLCGVRGSEGVKFDGVSVKDLMLGKDEGWPERYLITDSQRVVDPVKWRKSAVMTQGWRLVNGKELYAIEEDPGQRNDVAGQHPERVAAMREAYESWWAELEPSYKNSAAFVLGDAKASEVLLTAHDWISERMPPWNQAGVRGLEKWVCDKVDAYWYVDVKVAGVYELELRRWPQETQLAIGAGMAAGAGVPGASRAFRETKGAAIPVVGAQLLVNGVSVADFEVNAEDDCVRKRVHLAEGKQKLGGVFKLASGKQVGVCYLTVRKVEQ